MCYSFFTPSSVNGCLGCFHVLAIINTAARNIGYMCSFQLWFPQGIISPIVRLLGHMIILGFPGGSECKQSTCNARDLGLIPELGRSPREGNDYSLQYSCLQNSKDRGACQATVHGAAKSQPRLSD